MPEQPGLPERLFASGLNIPVNAPVNLQEGEDPAHFRILRRPAKETSPFETNPMR